MVSGTQARRVAMGLLAVLVLVTGLAAGQDKEKKSEKKDSDPVPTAGCASTEIKSGKEKGLQKRVDEIEWSPRLGIAWFVPKLGLVLRASYDRIFGTPAIENLLLSTSADVRTLNQTAAQLTLKPSRGNYYEVGATKELFHKARYSLNYY